MKVAVLSESPADEAAIRVFVEGLLGERSEPPSSMPPIRSRGCDAVLAILPAVLRHLHYQTDADALVVVVDSDLSGVHQEAHAQPGGVDQTCRLCRIKAIVRQVQRELAPQDPYTPVKTALGLAVPQIEAWYLVGRDRHVNEAAWIRGLSSGDFPYTGNTLKQKVYGTDRPSLRLETECAREAAERIVREGDLSRLEQLFPGGFGALANDVRSWGK